MLTFLRLFSAFRALEWKLAILEEERTRLFAENAKIQAVLDRKSADLEETLRKVADAYSFQAVRRNIFTKASDDIADLAPRESITIPGKMMGRDLVHRLEQKFWEDRLAAAKVTTEPPPPSAPESLQVP